MVAKEILDKVSYKPVLEGKVGLRLENKITLYQWLLVPNVVMGTKVQAGVRGPILEDYNI